MSAYHTIRFDVGVSTFSGLIPLLCLVIGLLHGCATTTSTARGTAEEVVNEQTQQQALAMRTQWRREARLNDLSWPLMANGIEICGTNVQNRFGIVYASLDAFDKNYRDTARTEFLINERPQVIHVTKGSPAELSGLNQRDVLISVGGEPVPTGRGATKNLAKLLNTAAESGNAVVFEVDRSDELLSFEFAPAPVCRYGVALVQDDSLNAFADGNNVYVTQGMIRFVENDQELQLILAHEIAHNAQGHMKKKVGNTLLGGFFDILAAAYGVDTQGAFSNMTGQMFSQEFEREADYVGMYLLALAGTDTIEVADFWRRMAAEYPTAIKGSFSSSHPATAERYTNINATHDEITTKLSTGSPLVPEPK